MTISTRLNSYLTQQNIPYQAIPHFHSSSSLGTAITADIPLHQIAKAVLLSDHEGRKLMAVLPADYKISLTAINEALHGSYQLIKESEVYRLFSDCEHGAVPPIAAAYNMNMVCERKLDELNNVYIEAGDHKTLLRIDHQSFETMMADGKHIRFSHPVFH